MVFKATLNNISVISLQLVTLYIGGWTWIPKENNRPDG